MPVVAQLGIMPGAINLFTNSQIMGAVNGTMYTNVYSVISIEFIVPLIFVSAVMIVLFIAVSTKKWIKLSGGE